VRQFLPRLKKQLPESCAVIDYSPLQGPIAQPEFAALKRSGTWRVIIFVSLAFRLEAIALSGHFSG
jgi:hypothetical protein